MKNVSRSLLIAVVSWLAACRDVTPQTKRGDSEVEQKKSGQATAAAADARPPIPPPPQRPGGPTLASCEGAADHLSKFVVSSVTATASEADRAYVARLAAENRSLVVWFCMQTATPAEVECMLAADDFATLAACERFRRQVADLLDHETPTLEDCERFFDRLRTFKIMDGVDPAVVDKDRDQILRACQDKGRPNTLACFIASRTYEQARKCP